MPLNIKLDTYQGIICGIRHKWVETKEKGKKTLGLSNKWLPLPLKIFLSLATKSFKYLK
jgi:hypothetical protein